ncbi:MAG: hypothetical protein GY705_25140 [Bacteroidetes bacterium]|nr:hypothetical protein [Bacteroidota bacterium]
MEMMVGFWSVLVLFFCLSTPISTFGSSGAAATSLQTIDARIGKIEKRMDSADQVLKSVREKQDAVLVFDGHRIGLIGLILSSCGLIVTAIVAIMTYKATTSLIEIKKMKSELFTLKMESDDLFKNMESTSSDMLNALNKKREEIDRFLEKYEPNILRMIDQAVVSVTSIAENKAMLLDDLENTENVAQLKAFIRSMLESDRDDFNKILYKVNLFHTDSTKVKQALIHYRKNGSLEDIHLIKKAISEEKSKEICVFADSVIRNIMKRP